MQLLLLAAVMIVMFILYKLGFAFAGIYLLCVIGLLAAVCVISMLRNQHFSNLLNWKCAPKEYLKIMYKRLKTAEKNENLQQSIKINIAAGEMCLGNYEDAKKQLLELDVSNLKDQNPTLFVYTVDLILCYYETGEIEQAERLYETNMVRLSPTNKKLKMAAEQLIGERYYYLGELDKSYDYLKKQLTFDLTKRQYLSIQYRLALIELARGETEAARKRLIKIVRLGNELGIVKESQCQLEKLELHK